MNDVDSAEQGRRIDVAERVKPRRFIFESGWNKYVNRDRLTWFQAFDLYMSPFYSYLLSFILLSRFESGFVGFKFSINQPVVFHATREPPVIHMFTEHIGLQWFCFPMDVLCSAILHNFFLLSATRGLVPFDERRIHARVHTFHGL